MYAKWKDNPSFSGINTAKKPKGVELRLKKGGFWNSWNNLLYHLYGINITIQFLLFFAVMRFRAGNKAFISESIVYWSPIPVR